MRIHPALTALGVGLVAVAITACSSGAKPTATTTPITTSSSTTAPATAALATTAPATTVGSSTAPSTTTAAGGGSAAKDVDACTLLTSAKASTLTGAHFTSTKSSTIAVGQDQCDYQGSPVLGLTVIVYQPTSGVTWTMLDSVLTSVGKTKTVTGVGDRSVVGSIELDAQAGTHLIAVQGAGGLLTGKYSGAVAVAKAVIAGLH